MSQITHEIRHGLTLEQAKRAAHRALDEYIARYKTRGFTASWATDTRAELKFAAKGLEVDAVVDVLDDVLRVEANVPLVLRPLKSIAIATAEREAQRWITKAKAETAAEPAADGG
ncbi:MAG: polyhydroxyalkanoic acid system family protein [Polyangiales bacterium]